MSRVNSRTTSDGERVEPTRRRSGTARERPEVGHAEPGHRSGQEERQAETRMAVQPRRDAAPYRRRRPSSGRRQVGRGRRRHRCPGRDRTARARRPGSIVCGSVGSALDLGPGLDPVVEALARHVGPAVDAFGRGVCQYQTSSQKASSSAWKISQWSLVDGQGARLRVARVPRRTTRRSSRWSRARSCGRCRRTRSPRFFVLS